MNLPRGDVVRQKSIISIRRNKWQNFLSLKNIKAFESELKKKEQSQLLQKRMDDSYIEIREKCIRLLPCSKIAAEN